MYRENLQMNEALALHAARVQELETQTERLEAANRSGRIDRLVLKFMFTIIMHCFIPVGSITGPSYVLRTQGIGSGERSQWETTGLTSTECETVPAANLSTSGVLLIAERYQCLYIYGFRKRCLHWRLVW